MVQGCVCLPVFQMPLGTAHLYHRVLVTKPKCLKLMQLREAFPGPVPAWPLPILAFIFPIKTRQAAQPFPLSSFQVNYSLQL